PSKEQHDLQVHGGAISAREARTLKIGIHALFEYGIEPLSAAKLYAHGVPAVSTDFPRSRPGPMKNPGFPGRRHAWACGGSAITSRAAKRKRWVAFDRASAGDDGLAQRAGRPGPGRRIPAPRPEGHAVGIGRRKSCRMRVRGQTISLLFNFQGV